VRVGVAVDGSGVWVDVAVAATAVFVGVAVGGAAVLVLVGVGVATAAVLVGAGVVGGGGAPAKMEMSRAIQGTELFWPRKETCRAPAGTGVQ
jgi:hypothetical protein